MTRHDLQPKVKSCRHSFVSSSSCLFAQKVRFSWGRSESNADMDQKKVNSGEAKFVEVQVWLSSNLTCNLDIIQSACKTCELATFKIYNKAQSQEVKGICNGKGWTRLHFQLTIRQQLHGGKKRKMIFLRGCERRFDDIRGLEMYAFHVTALSHVGVVQSAWSWPVKKEFIHIFAQRWQGLCYVHFLRRSAVKHFAPQNNRISRRRMRNPELSEVQIKSASCGDKKKKKKRSMKFDKVSLALVGKSQCFSTKQAHLLGGACNAEGTFFFALHRDPSIPNRPLMSLQES